MKINNDFYKLLIFCIVVIILAFIGYATGYDLSTVLALLSIFISITTICAMYIQNKHLSNQVSSMRQQTGLAQNTTSYSLAFELQRIFLDNPDLWPYFHGGKEIESNCSEEKIAKIEIVALTVLDYYEVILAMQKFNPLPKNEEKGWNKYIINEFKKSPALRMVYEKYKSSYKYTLDDLYSQTEKELKKD